MAEMVQLSMVAVFTVLIFLTWRDLSFTEQTSQTQKDIKAPKLSRFAGYKKVFEQYAHAIHERFPALSIEGDNYPPPSGRAAVAQFLSIFKLVLIAMVIYACLMIFFISNAIEGQMISTGAFEVSFNDVPVWSKLETGRVPSPAEMFQIIDNHMKLNNREREH
ncbi:hypothetical protein KUTeg_011989 [Tegillarca granosa]|uniref:Selenoprotein T n=1 Tax=Tegillarca granosa TaxID=220873 RepID=A0ABQ9EYG7_TEGGR|nr:hypothetical protein KUTeg_011989 [Tegillarca granosa]